MSMKDEAKVPPFEDAKEERQSVAVNEKTLAAWEIASVTSSFLIAEWMVLPFAGNSRLAAAVPLALALGLMLLSHRARGESARELGWRLDNFKEALRLLAVPMLAAAALIVGTGFLLRGLHFTWGQFGEWALWLPLWGLLQQYVLQGFINRRAQIIFGRGSKSVLLVALIFALLHLPNPWLSIATFAGGALWAYVYQRVPNLPALALSHALMSIVFAFALPPSATGSLRVGIKYFG
ncbi:MAG TPA: CPBP family intramembrane glutamic endopeptidase [Pyrinomonadaceae bacterium]